MKKRYICPNTETIQIETNQMIALSGELDSTKNINRSEDFGSRGGGGFWDDDDDEY